MSDDIRSERYLHVVPDEKFIAAAHAAFEDVAPDRNDYVFIGGSRHLHHIGGINPLRVSPHQILRGEFPSTLRNYRAVFVHYMSDEARVLIDRAKGNVNVVWIGWGKDYYHLIVPSLRDLLLPVTRQLYDRMSRIGLAGRWSNGISKLREEAGRAPSRWLVDPRCELRFHSEMSRLRAGSPDDLPLLNGIRLFAPVLEGDYARITHSVPDFGPSYVLWNYGLPRGMLEALEELPDPRAANVLIGNSATFENNHLDAFEAIAPVLGNRRILCPLGYGRRDYASSVERLGRDLFGNRFEPMRSFVEFNRYIATLRSCSVAIMNHVRQQAMGTVAIMLYHGARVFLRRENPVSSFLERAGAIFFDMEAVRDELPKNLGPLSPDEVEVNRAVVLRHFGAEAIREKTRALIETAGSGIADG